MKSLSLYLKLFLLYAIPAFVCLPVFSQTTGFSGTGANIDVKYHRLEWALDPGAGKTISGTATTYFETKQNNVSLITFDFAKASFNNGSLVVKYHGSSAGVGVSFPASGNVNILNITLPVTLPINTLDSVSITYSGTPPNFATYGEGMDLQTITGLGTAIYTLAESYGDDDFWPCKADMQDKIDSIDFIITTPSAYRAAANGALISDVIVSTNRVMTYKHRYPITSYLVAVSVAQYNVYNRTPVIINGTSVPIVYYIGSGRAPSAANFTTMDYCRDQMVAFSNVFGDYPFKNEKYGMYEFGWGGGMEHQTFSAMSWSSMINKSVVAHELAHQWFGDKVTFGTWNHLWLAEGFARYCEALAAELVPAMAQSASTLRSSYKSTANNATNRAYGCYIPPASIVNSNTIWNSAYGTTVYERGAMVVSMLRMLLGDTKFYQACQNYMNDPALAYRSATTDDLRNHMQAVAGGYDLTAFFDSYVYGNGYPSYSTSIKWGNPGANRINFKVTTQTKSAGSTVTYYHTPIAIRVRGSLASEDTVLVIYDQNGQLSRGGNGISAPIAGNYISFMLGFTPVTVTFDPFSQTLATGAAPAFDGADPLLNFSTLPVNVIDFTLKENNFSNELKLSLSDINGELRKIVLQKSSNGIDFTDAGEMEEKQAGSAGLRSYLYTDYSPNAVAYYRARIVEVNSVKYSSIVKSNRSLSTAVSVYPNPAQKEVTVRWADFTVSGGEAEVNIISMDGRQVWSKTTSAGFVHLSVAAFPAGAYMIHVKQNEKIIFNRQLMITK